MEKKTEDIIIPLGKSKIVLFFILSLAFVALGIWFFLFSFHLGGGNFIRASFLKISGILIAILFSFGGIVFLRKFFDKKPGLILTSEGICDNSAGVMGERFIFWKDILGLKVVEIQGTRLLVILLHRPEIFLTNPVRYRQKMLEYNFKTYGSPIILSSNALNIEFEELYRLMVKVMEQHSCG